MPAPDTLPADFFDKAPDTLPPDFFEEERPRTYGPTMEQLTRGVSPPPIARPKLPFQQTEEDLDREFASPQRVQQAIAEFGGTPVQKHFGLPTASEAYDSVVEGARKRFHALPPEAQKNAGMRGMAAAGKFAASVGRIVPEGIDFATSPGGAEAIAMLGPAARVAPRIVGAGLSATMAPEAYRATEEVIANPTAENAGTAVKDLAMVGLPMLAFRRGKPRSNEAPNPEPLVEKPSVELDALKAQEAAIAPDTPYVARSAADAAESFVKPPITKDAKQSADVFKTRLEQREAKQAREAVSIPEEGISEEAARLDDFAQRTAGKPLDQLAEADRKAVEQLYAENQAGKGVREPKEMERLPSPPRRNPPAAESRRMQRGSIPINRAAKPKPIEEEFLNFDRIKVSPQEEMLLRSSLRGMAERGEVTKDVEPHAAIIAEAKNIDPALVREISMEDGIQGRAARQVIRERINALGREITTAADKLKGPLTAEERAPLEGTLERMNSDLKNYLTMFAGIRTEAGRNLAALKIMARNTLDLDWWVAEAKRSMRLPQGAELPEAKLKIVRAKVAEAQSAKDPVVADQKKKELADTVAKMRENGWLETGVALWRAGLLTGVKTHARNVGGNILFGAMEEAARVPAALADMAMATKTGKRTTAGANPMAIIRASTEAATRGVREAKQIMQRGASSADLAKGEQKREWNFQGLSETLPRTNDMINRYINFVGRMLGAEDKIAKVYALRRSLEAQARIQALNEVRSGVIQSADLARRTAELVQNPTDKISTEAIAYADFVTFNNENALAIGVERMASAFRAPGKALLAYGLPFRRTPFNIFYRLMDYTPVGAVARPAIEAYKASSDGQAFDAQKVIAEAFGRGSVGTGLLALGWYLGKAGLATGTGQEEPAKRNVQTAAGRIPGSVKVGSDWWKVAAFAPGGALLQIGAQLAREQSRSLKDELKRPANIAKVASRALLEQPMLQAARETVEVLENPDSRAENFVASRGGSLVPAIVSDVSTAINPERPAGPPKNSGMAASALHGAQSRLPFLRGKLPPQTDVLGRKPDARRSNAINPFTPSEAREATDPLFKELIASDVGIGGVKQNVGESDADYRERKNLIGEYIEDSLRSLLPSLSEDPEERREQIRKAITKAKREMSKELKVPVEE